MKTLPRDFDPGSGNKLRVEKAVNINQNKIGGDWRAHHLEETACAKILEWGLWMELRDRGLVGTSHGEFDFIPWTIVNHLDSSQKNDITRFVFAKYDSSCYMKDGF